MASEQDSEVSDETGQPSRREALIAAARERGFIALFLTMIWLMCGGGKEPDQPSDSSEIGGSR